MGVISSVVKIKTKGRTEVINITEKVNEELSKTGLDKGVVTIFVKGSTAAITTIEYESALVTDIKGLFEKLIPSNISYAHDDTWGDANGYSHLRASMLGPSLTVPFEKKTLFLGTWQQIVLLDFDNRPRDRQIMLQFIGE